VAYGSTRELYDLERRVTDTDEQIGARRAEIARLEDAASRSAFDFINKAATPEQRAQAVLDTKQAAERIGHLKSEIDLLEQDRARDAQKLETCRSNVASTRQHRVSPAIGVVISGDSEIRSFSILERRRASSR
jgi:uncharacterized small protein (DUF1192 family)